MSVNVQSSLQIVWLIDVFWQQERKILWMAVLCVQQDLSDPSSAISSVVYADPGM